jgi:acetyltransferase-like isoleucine patch superfamily enzyme
MAANYSIGKNSKIDKNALLGHPVSRKIKPVRLVIGAHAVVRSGTIIYQGSRIGAHFETGHNVVIREENNIGGRFSIWNNSTVDYGCVIGNNVKIHCNCYIAQFTVIEDDVFIAPGVTIANDLHPGCAFSMQCLKGPRIKKGAKIGVNSTILPDVTIGEYSLVGSGSVVTRDVPPYSVVYGNPAAIKNDVFHLKCASGLSDKPYKKEKK